MTKKFLEDVVQTLDFRYKYEYSSVPYYMKFWRHVNLAILKNPYLVTPL